jgi:hypothetical protein
MLGYLYKHFLKNPNVMLCHPYSDTFCATGEAIKWGNIKVNFDGKVLDVTSIEKVGFGIDEQLTKLIAQEKFEPATQNGVKYRSEIILDVPVKANYLKQIFNK